MTSLGAKFNLSQVRFRMAFKHLSPNENQPGKIQIFSHESYIHFHSILPCSSETFFLSAKSLEYDVRYVGLCVGVIRINYQSCASVSLEGKAASPTSSDINL